MELKPLQDLVTTLDQRYWEHQSEINKDKKSSNATSSLSTSNSNSANKLTSSGNNCSGSQQSGAEQNNQQQQKNKDQKKPTLSTSSTSETLLLACLAPTESSLPRNASAVWTTSSVFVVERLATWFWIVPRAPGLRLRLGLRPLLLLLPLPLPLWVWEKYRQSSAHSTAGGLRKVQQ